MDKFKDILKRCYEELDSKEEINVNTSSNGKPIIEINLRNYYNENGEIVESKMDNYSKIRELLGE